MTRLSTLTAATTVASTDIFLLANDPSGTNIEKKITADNLFASSVIIAPGSSTRNVIQASGNFTPLVLRRNAGGSTAPTLVIGDESSTSLSVFKADGAWEYSTIDGDPTLTKMIYGAKTYVPTGTEIYQGARFRPTLAPTTSTTSSGYGGVFAPRYTGSGAISELYGAQGTASMAGSGAVDAAYGVYGTVGGTGVNAITNVYGLKGLAAQQASSATSVWANAYGVHSEVDASSATAGTITNAKILYGTSTVSGSGVITNLYGLYLENMNGGSTLSYAIYTNLGQVRLGDNLVISGNRSYVTWTTSGKGLDVQASTLTDTTGSGTIALKTVNSIGVPTLVSSSSQTITMSTNLYIAGAPVASTNVTQTAKTALFVDTGAAASIGETIRGTSSQSAVLTQWLNNSNTVLAVVDSAGKIGISTSSPAQAIHIVNGNIRMDQVAAAGAPTVAVGAAGVLTGAYLYGVTFVTALGETSFTTLSGSVSPSSQQVNLTNIPVSVDATVTARKIYRTAAGGAFNTMKLVTTIADNTTTTYTDNLADGSLGVTIPTKNSTGSSVFTNTIRTVTTDIGFTGLGYGTGSLLTGGYQSVAIGTNSLVSATTGIQNTGVGYLNLEHVTTAGQNVAMGTSTGNGLTTGGLNTYIGYGSGQFNQTGVSNTFVGYTAGRGSGTNSHSNNTGIGLGAGNALTTGGSNVLIGYGAGNTLTTGSGNVILGYSIQTPAVGTSNFMSIGNLIFSAGVDGTGTTLSTGNVGIGVAAPAAKLHVYNGNIRSDNVTAPASAISVATGAAGVLTGVYQYACTFGTALGETDVNVTYISSTVSPSSQQVNLTNIPVSADPTVTSRKIYRTTAGGTLTAMQLVTTIADNTTTTYSDNIADGSLTTFMAWKNTTGGEFLNNTSRIISSSTRFTGFGQGLAGAAGGYESIAIGTGVLANQTSGIFNVGMGFQALTASTTAANNTAVGRRAGTSLTTGGNNTYIGQSAGQFNVTGTQNTFIGSSAGVGSASNSNSNNTGIGCQTGIALTTGSNNVLVGIAAGSTLTTGGFNVILGYNIQTPAVSTSNFMSLGNLIFSAGADGTGTTVSSGNIGIGIAAPVAKLHVSAASSAISSATWTTTGKIFATDALTITNTTSTGTVALQVENSFGVPTLVASSATTLTMSANVYIAGAPIASTNVTQTTPVSLLIDTGATTGRGLVIRGASGQNSAADLLLILSNGGNILFEVGGTGQVLTAMTDSVTNTVTNVIQVTHNTTGTPAANYGSAIKIFGKSDTSNDRDMARIRTYWNTATDASRKAYAILSASDSAAERDVIGFGASGSAGLLGFYPTIAAAPIAQPTTGIASATFTANTSAIANDTATFDGYTIGQVVKALRNLGLLA